MTDVPDMAGYRDAQERLVAGLGSTVSFNFADNLSFASGVYIDPELGVPLDPTITPSASSPASASISVKATVIRKSPSNANDGDAAIPSIIPVGHAWLRIPDGTYDVQIFNATTVSIGNETFRIERFIEDGLDQIDRLYVECSLIDDDHTT